jgi:hypothetical protein
MQFSTLFLSALVCAAPLPKWSHTQEGVLYGGLGAAAIGGLALATHNGAMVDSAFGAITRTGAGSLEKVAVVGAVGTAAGAGVGAIVDVSTPEKEVTGSETDDI